LLLLSELAQIKVDEITDQIELNQDQDVYQHAESVHRNHKVEMVPVGRATSWIGFNLSCRQNAEFSWESIYLFPRELASLINFLDISACGGRYQCSVLTKYSHQLREYKARKDITTSFY
jgi:hypothetical protein